LLYHTDHNPKNSTILCGSGSFIGSSCARFFRNARTRCGSMPSMGMMKFGAMNFVVSTRRSGRPW